MDSQAKYGIDPQSIPNNDMRWVKYRAEPQTEFMRSVRKLANSKSPEAPCGRDGATSLELSR